LLSGSFRKLALTCSLRTKGDILHETGRAKRVAFLCKLFQEYALGIQASCPSVSNDVELPTLGQCNDAATDRSGVRWQGIESPDHLHAGGAVGDETMNDPIVDEVRQVRDAHAARFHYDLDAIFRDIKEQEKKSGRKFVCFAPARAEPNHALEPTGAALPVSRHSE
jgi:hypothetical protein